MARLKLDKKIRLHRSCQFKKVLKASRCQRMGILTVHSAPNGLSYSRYGVITSKHLGNAVNRNRLKRICREAFRLSQYKMAAGYDYVVLFNSRDPKFNKHRKNSFTTLKSNDIRDLLVNASRRLHNK